MVLTHIPRAIGKLRLPLPPIMTIESETAYTHLGTGGRLELFPFGCDGQAEADAVERGPGRDEQGLAVLAAEDQAGGTLRDLDGVDLFAGGVEDKNLAGGDVDVALVVGRDAFAALVDEELWARRACRPRLP